MTYNLNLGSQEPGKRSKMLSSLKKLLIILAEDKKVLALALAIIMVNATISLLAPLITGHTIDTFVQAGDYKGLITFSGILLGMYLVTLVTGYFQTKLMGGVGQRVLYKLRNSIFKKIQELPVAFFNENKTGDLISRINNDTEKLQQFFAQSLMQFVSSLFVMAGSAVFLLSINLPLGTATLLPTIFLLLFTRLVTPWVKKKNAESLASTGLLSAEIQESLANFKVVIAFNRRNFFRERFQKVNNENFRHAVKAGLSNSLFAPVYGFFAHIGQLVVLTYGIYLVSKGRFTVGLLISFLSYVNSFYNPLRQLAALWTNFQVALAGWDRIARILSLETNLAIIPRKAESCDDTLLSFRNVSFSYPNGREVLHRVSFELEKGRTYAFVGPTGGGKTTTASLMARLYDPVRGVILLNGIDIRSFLPEDRTKKIGFILQEPFLFSGSVKENILYGNDSLADISHDQLIEIIHQNGLENLLQRFEEGLETKVLHGGETISLGQKQLIAFIRAVLRKPEILILDEATANIDTVTEQLLASILKKLPDTTTRVIIAHRLNTIENADEIFFVNSTRIIRAGSMDNAVKLLMHEKRES